MRIGIDLGGTKIEAIALDDTGQERARVRVPTPAQYPAVVESIVRVVGDIESRLRADEPAAGTAADPLCNVGIGIPGTISPATGLVKNANSQQLIGHPLDRDLSDALGRPVRVANDANCLALSEAADGAAAAKDWHGKWPRVVFGVIIGTGTGGGVVVDGKVLVGTDGIAGEWGHNPLPWPRDDEWPEPKCWCGRTACLELYLSGPAVARDHEKRVGRKMSAVEVAQAAAGGDAAAIVTLERYQDRLARGLTTIINAINPDVIVLGGGMSNVLSLYESVPRLWSQYVFSDVVTTRLVRAQHGDSSGVRGAAWLWPL